MTKRTHKINVDTVRAAILNFACTHNIPPDVMIQAMAEIIGIAAANLDRVQGHQPFDSRIGAVVDHARAVYNRGAIDIQMSKH